MASSGNAFTLRLRRPEEEPFIGKFLSKANFDAYADTKPGAAASSQSSSNVLMYLHSQEVREDHEEEDVVKDSEYYKKKKAPRKRKYDKTSKLVIEDSSSKETGKMVLAKGIGKFEGTLVDLSSEIDVSNNEPNLFKYALLEVVTGKDSTEVNVIPVNNMFVFRRPPLTADRLLHEVDEDYDEKIRKDKQRLQKYRRIGKVLEDLEMQDSTSSGGRDGRDLDDSNMPARDKDGFEIPALFGSLSKKAKLSKKGKVMDSSSGLADEDVEKELNQEFTGDYSAKFVDDEEDNIVLEQNYLNAVEDQYNADRETVDVNQFSDDDEEEENEEEEDIPAPGGVIIQAPSTFAGIDNAVFDESTRQLKEKLLQSSKKRSHEDLSSSDRSMVTDSADTSSKRASPMPPSVSEKVVASEIYSLSEEGIKAYIIAMGGRVPTATLKKVEIKS